jgi:hypothetical protein
LWRENQNKREKKMKKTMMMLTAAALTAGAAALNTGCDIDAELRSPVVIDEIVVDPHDWIVARVGGQFDHIYCDIELRELTDRVLENGAMQTYWRYGEMRDGQMVDVQEPLPAVIHLASWTETISCSYEPGSMRIMISRSDFVNPQPDKKLYFRIAIFY